MYHFMMSLTGLLIPSLITPHFIWSTYAACWFLSLQDILETDVKLRPTFATPSHALMKENVFQEITLHSSAVFAKLVSKIINMKLYRFVCKTCEENCKHEIWAIQPKLCTWNMSKVEM